MATNRYQAVCGGCGVVVSPGEGSMRRGAGKWLVQCELCAADSAHAELMIEQADADDTRGESEPGSGLCGWLPPAFVDRQVEGHVGTHRCDARSLPGMTVCAQHASKDALVIALAVAHERIAELEHGQG